MLHGDAQIGAQGGGQHNPQRWTGSNAEARPSGTNEWQQSQPAPQQPDRSGLEGRQVAADQHMSRQKGATQAAEHRHQTHGQSLTVPVKRPVAVRHKDHGSRYQQSTHPGPCAESLPHQHDAAEAGQHWTHRFQRESSAGAQASQGGEIEAVTGGDAHAAAE
ncbi:hypothetical protein SynA1524_01213 [Synechococcus sp. A15-24]|nr:hypothetical protein SynA1524_01213 [Synechococcus sp. A15-24]